jgi:exopolyphosphatase
LNLKQQPPPVKGIDGLNRMLRSARRMIKIDATQHVIMGNESADMDSMASALMYAYFLSSLQPSPAAVPIPLMNIPRADFKLRKDVAFLFREAGIDEMHLIFRDEIDLAALRKSNKLKLCLVDHHHLAESQAELSSAVVEILDHHPQTAHFPDSVRCQIEPVGSTATLVAEKIIAHRPDLLDARLAGLLLSTIVVDTLKLDVHFKKVTSKDLWIAEYLNRKHPLAIDRQFTRLTDLRSDVSGLNADQLLRKDFKALRLGQIVCGISAVPLSLETWMDDPTAGFTAVRDFARAHCLDLYLLMLYQRKPRFKRQLAAYAADQTLLERTITFLTAHGVALVPSPCGIATAPAAICLRCFEQTDPQISRKKIIKELYACFQ